MKRFFFSLIALSAAAIGCTQSALVETPDLFGTEITFNPYTGRTPVTKATEVNTPQTLSYPGFHILSYLNKDGENSVYMNGLVTGSTSNGTTTWDYQGNTAYWPDASTHETTTLSFVGFSANAKTQIEDPTQTALVFTVNETVSEQVDFLATKYQTGLSLDSNSSGVVDLDFIHLLSRVGFQLKANKTNDNIKITIKRLELCGTIPTEGTLNLLSAVDAVADDSDNGAKPAIEVSPATGPVTYSLLQGNTKTLTSSEQPQQINNPSLAADNCYMMIMPHTSVDDKIVVEYVITSAGGQSSGTNIAEVPLDDSFVFAPGTAYEFVLQVSTSSIGFTVEETDWNGESKDVQIDPQPVDPIDVGASVKGYDIASVAVNVNVDKYSEIYVEYMLAGNDGSVSDNWPDATSKKVESYIAYQIGGPYNLELAGLNPNTYYQYRVRGVKSDSSYEYTEPKTFVTEAKISTNDVVLPEDVTSFGATIKALWDVTNGGAELKEVGFCWIQGTDDEPTTRLFLGKAFSGITTSAFKHTITTLEPQKVYSFRPYVINKAGGVSYGKVKQFTTSIALETPDAGDNGGNEPETGDDEPIDPWEGEDNDPIPFE